MPSGDTIAQATLVHDEATVAELLAIAAEHRDDLEALRMLIAASWIVALLISGSLLAMAFGLDR